MQPAEIQDHRRTFLLSAGGTPDALREIVQLLRDGWRVIESRPADRVGDALPTQPGLGAGPFALVILERQPP